MSVSCLIDSVRACVCTCSHGPAEQCRGVNMQTAAMPGYSHKANEVEYTSLYGRAKKSQSPSHTLFLVGLFCYFCVCWQAASNILFPPLNSV